MNRVLKFRNRSCLCTASFVLAGLLTVSMRPVIAAGSTVDTYTPDRALVMINGSLADDNFGGAPGLGSGRIASSVPLMRSLMSFNVGNLTGQNIEVQSISLTVTPVWSNAYQGGDTITPEIAQIATANNGWVEGNGGGSGAPNAGQSSWNSQLNPSTPWAGSAGLSTSGVDYTTQLAVLPITLPANATPGDPSSGANTSDPNYQTQYVFNFTGSSAALTSLISTWAAENVSGFNPGVLMFDQNENTLNDLDRLTFVASGAGAPVLSVAFITVPEPTGAGLLACGLAALVVARRRGFNKTARS